MEGQTATEATEAAAEATAKERDRRRPLTIYGARGGGARKRDEVLDVLNFETQKEEGREEGGRKRFLVSFRISWRTLVLVDVLLFQNIRDHAYIINIIRSSL